MHTPVMLDKIESFVKNRNFNTIVDCTYGFGGHNKVLQKYCAKIISIDRDEHIVNNNKHVIHDTFNNIDKYIDFADMIFADLGMSNMQINSDRGFSFMHNSQLYMTMGLNNTSGQDVLNSYNFGQLVSVFKNGDCKNPTLLAKKIIEFRLHETFINSDQLKQAIGTDNYRKLAKIFQAIRIEVNDEINQLKNLIAKSINRCKYLVIITFHSIEEEIVKLQTKHLKFNIELPCEREIVNNPQSRSAKMFIINC